MHCEILKQEQIMIIINIVSNSFNYTMRRFLVIKLIYESCEFIDWKLRSKRLHRCKL